MDKPPKINGQRPYHGRKIGDQWVLTNILWPLRMDIAELNVTNACNLKCPNCQANCPLAPSEEHLSVKSIKEFVDQSLDLRHRWKEIKLTGGEPTLNPELLPILAEIERYKQQHNVPVVILTNGTKLARKVLEHIPKWCVYRSRDTATTNAWEGFESVNTAPIDIPEYANVDEKVYEYGCPRTTVCHGPTLGTNGKYYACPVLFHVDRVFNLNTGLNDLKSLLSMSEKEIRTYFFRRVCRYCGFFKYPRDVTGEQQMSPTWKNALQKYNSKNLKTFL